MEAYAQDEELFFKNYARAHVKVSEIGYEGKLLSEVEPNRMIDGGFQEESRLARAVLVMRTQYTAYMTGQSYEELLALEEDASRQIEEK